MVVGDSQELPDRADRHRARHRRDWAQRRGLTYTTYRDLTDKPEVRELIQEVVDTTNEKFARVENIRKFALIPKELDHEDGELTATQKIKRSAMMELFGDLVDSMYR